LYELAHVALPPDSNIIRAPQEEHTQQRLVGTSTSGNNSNHSTCAALDDLLGSTGKLDTSLALVGVVADNSNVVARSAAEAASVANLLLNVGDNGTFGDGAQREDVADGQSSLLSGVDELASVHALIGDESLGIILELVWVTEGNASEGSSSAGVVNDLLHNAASVSVSLGIVESSELGGSLVKTGVGR
jgi:hypothetical protein